MQTVSLADAQAKLPELIAALPPGGELVIDSHGAPLAKLTKTARTSWPCQPGSAKHLPHWMAPDFDAPLDDFHEYME
jgi:antitoxin (DNA-binding transcriptional repressor) of toxin-antitoxin stability system